MHADGLIGDLKTTHAPLHSLEDGTMPMLLVLYPPPADVGTFERRYETEHAPMVLQKIPGLKKFLAARVLGTPEGAVPYQRVAELYFDSIESCRR